MSFANRLDEAMRRANFSQKKLAETVGLSEMSISRYRKGERQPRSEDIQKIAAALGTTAAYLMEESANMGSAFDHKGILILTGKDLASRLKARREELGLSQKAVADMTNSAVTQAHISKIERGDSDTTTEVLRELCRVLKVSASFMMGETDNPTGEKSNRSPAVNNSAAFTHIDVPLISCELHNLAERSNGMLDVIGTYPLFDADIAQIYSPEILRALVMEGDSMEPKIHDRDIVIFNTSNEVIYGCVYAVKLGKRIFVKGVIPHEQNKSFTLRSWNKDYADIEVNDQTKDFQILGRVLTVITKRTVAPVI